MLTFSRTDRRDHTILFRASEAAVLAGEKNRDKTATAWTASEKNLDGLRTFFVIQGDANGRNGVPVPGCTTTSYNKARNVAKTRVGLPLDSPLWRANLTGRW